MKESDRIFGATSQLHLIFEDSCEVLFNATTSPFSYIFYLEHEKVESNFNGTAKLPAKSAGLLRERLWQVG